MALLRSLDSQVSAPTYLANVATQGETAYALEALERLLDFIRQVQERDKAFPGNESLTRRESGGAGKGQHHWQIDPNGVLRKSGKVWIPNNATLRETILLRNYDDPIGGHFSIEKTVKVLKQKYY